MAKTEAQKREIKEAWRINNLDRFKATQKKYRASPKGRETRLKYGRIYGLAYTRKHKDRINALRREKYKKNSTIIQARNKRWRENNKESVKTTQRNYNRQRYQNDSSFRLEKQIRHRVRLALKGVAQSYRTLQLIGCSIEQLREWLEAQFEPGMTWKNHGEWHVDHIRPCASFDLSDPAQQKQCFNFTNLQPLWAEDNWTKNDHFQER